MQLKLKTKLQFYFLLIGILSVSLTSIIIYYNSKNTLEKISFERLTSIMGIKKKLIENYFDQLKNITLMLSEDENIVKSVSGPNENKNESKIKNSELTNIASRFALRNITILSSSGNKIFFSTDSNQITVPSGIRETGLKALGCKRNEVVINDFNFYSGLRKPAAFISSPVYQKSVITGVVIIEFSVDQINQIMTNNNSWKELGFGETSETYIAGPDLKMRTDSRFFIQEPEKYFAMLKKTGTDEKIINLIKRDSTSILHQEVKTEATRDGNKGLALTKIITDYRGVEVISAFSPLYLEDLKWVIVSEIDTSEAFGTISSLKEYLILASLVIILLAASLGVAISRKISSPISSLIKAADLFGKRNLDYRAKVVSNDEFSLLFDTFNAMAEKIMTYTSELELEIEDRKKISDELMVSREELRNLSSHLQTVREEERKLVAREIHDELGQALNTLKLKLSLHRRIERENDETVNDSYTGLFGMIDKTINTVRRIITELRPQMLDDLGLSAAIEWQVNEFSKNTGIDYSLSNSTGELKVDGEKSIALFRILQEALTNIARHSEASYVNISINETNNSIELIIEDNGKGIPESVLSNSASFGIMGMKERARYMGGEFHINSSINKGTVIKVKVNKYMENK